MASQLNNLGSQGVVYLEMGEAVPAHNIDIATLEENLQQGDIMNIAVMGYLDRQISLLHAAYATRSDHIYKCLNIYVVIQRALLTALFSYAQQQMKPGTTGCTEQYWWTTVPLVLLTIASASLIYCMLRQFVGQFQLLKSRRQFQEDRRNFLVAQRGITSKIGNRFLLMNYNRESVICHEKEDHISEKYNHITCCWWAAERIAFLGFLIAFSMFLLLSCTLLLCSQTFDK